MRLLFGRVPTLSPEGPLLPNVQAQQRAAQRVGVHRVRIVEIASPTQFKVLDLEAFDATPIIDIKPVLDRVKER